MDLGLYWLKFPFREMIKFLLPYLKNTNPNLISYAILPLGIIMAVNYHFALTTTPELYLVGIVLGFLRMIVATLDGLVAVHYNKSTALGDFLNRITPEMCDLMLIPVLVCTKGLYPLGTLVLVFSWATPFFGYVGAPCGLPVQSVGPVGQTDRLATLMLFSFLQFLSIKLDWGIDFITYLFYWLIIGGALTLTLRFYRHYREAEKKDSAK
jgi:phosphatidylglycerophosphate synthase